MAWSEPAGSSLSQATANLSPTTTGLVYGVSTGSNNNIGTLTARTGFTARYNYSPSATTQMPILCEDIVANATSPIAVTSTSSLSTAWAIVGGRVQVRAELFGSSVGRQVAAQAAIGAGAPLNRLAHPLAVHPRQRRDRNALGLGGVAVLYAQRGGGRPPRFGGRLRPRHRRDDLRRLRRDQYLHAGRDRIQQRRYLRRIVPVGLDDRRQPHDHRDAQRLMRVVGRGR